MKSESRVLATRFETVKTSRLKAFQNCFQHVSQALGTIYRDLTKDTLHPLGGNAFLTAENVDEPYLGGIRFTAMPPMKRFRDMDQLSGGEKTMASLAFLFSFQSFRQAPFFVLDEIDAALDNINVKNLAAYVRSKSAELQCVVISLKDAFYDQADSLIGICKDCSTLSTLAFHFNMKFFTTDQAEKHNNNDEQ